MFLIVGGLTVAIDFLSYHVLLAWTPLSFGLAKTFGFVAGTVFSYFVNRFWTFGHVTHPAGSHWRFFLLYAVTLGVNVSANGILLEHSPVLWSPVHFAFIFATGISAALNFAGMKFIVFRTLPHGGPI